MSTSPLTLVVAASSSLKSVYDVAKGFLGARDAVLTQTQAVELLGKINSAQQALLDAQGEVAARMDEVGKLKAEIAALKNWDAAKQQYRLAEVAKGVLAYAPLDRNDQVAHWICANRYQ